MFELKQLPDTLKYAYLDEKNIYPVIISADHSEQEEERLSLQEICQLVTTTIGH